MHGPYVGKYKELSNMEKKTAKRKTKDGKFITAFTMKANVHLKKEKEHEEEKHNKKHNKEHEKEHNKEHEKKHNKEHKKEHKGGFKL
jgi:ABC-type Zn2+ transport system substrate-binding protein/surface adhesin